MSQDDFSSNEDICHGTMIGDLDKPLVLYKNRVGSLKALHRRMMLVAVGLVFLLYSFLSTYPELWWQAVCYVLFLVYLYVAQRRHFSRAVLPVLEMNSTGIVIRSFCVKISIPWNEIKEVRHHKFIVSFIGIVPIKTSKTASRGTFLTQCFIWSNLLCLYFYRLFGVFMAPIEVLASEFPISAESLSEEMNLRLTHALELARQNELRSSSTIVRLDLPE